MPRDTKRDTLLTRRAALLAAGQGVLGAALIARLYQLQILESDRYTVLAEENRVNLRLLAPARGRILDRFGVPLADNRRNYRVVIVPEQADDLEATLRALGGVIELDEAERRRVLREARRKHSFVPIVVRANLSWPEVARIEVATPELPGVSIEEGLVRNYPYGATTAHVLGYVAAVSEKELTGDPLLELPDFRIGKSGIEKSQDIRLRGLAGASEVEVNAHGRVVRELSRRPGKAGEDVVLGLDIAMQEFLARRVAREPSVACVLLDAPTGEVLAMLSSPSFDPMQFSTGLTQAAWRELANDERHPLIDKAAAGVYPPGSTFKPVVALAGLEAGVITPETGITCPGHFTLGSATFHCWRDGGHGTLRLREAIKQSCDVFFYETARRLGIERLAAMARRFGLGQPLGLEITGERGGLIPGPDWKRRLTGGSWTTGETLIAGIGQGAVLATPLQLATMTARLVTGRAVVPRLVRDRVMIADSVPPGPMPPDRDETAPSFPALGVNPGHRALVLDGLNAVVNEQRGTAYAARITDPAYAMGGKSGTSQVRRISQYEREHGVRKASQVPWRERDHALFISYAPVQAPRYVCATIVEHGGADAGGGSAVAAPICRDVLLEVQRRDPARRAPASGVVAESLPDRRMSGGEAR
jgi:penicillin-binding protein 2